MVEDDSLVREHLMGRFREMGYRVLGVASGADALDLMKQNQRINLLFTDIVLPSGMNGRLLAETARTLRPEVKVLYTSGYSVKAMVDQERLDPDVEFLGKLYRLEKLAAKVRKALDHK